MNRLKNLFLRNWKAKLITLVGSFCLWIILAAQQSAIVAFPGQLPVEFKNLNSSLVALANNDFVSIKFSTQSINLSSVKESNFSAYIDLTDLSEGTYTKDITVTSKDPNIQIVSIAPNKTTVRIEKQISKKVPVSIRVDGVAKQDFIASDSSSTVTEAEVLGPESIVKTVSEAVAVIKLNGEGEDFQRSADLVAFGANGEIIKNISFNPSTIPVKITISASAQARSVGIKVALEGSVALGYQVSAITTDPEIITISGSSESLSSTRYVETQAINVNGLNQEKTFTTKLNIPSGIVVEDKNQTVKVKITVTNSANIKEFKVSPSVTGLNVNQKASIDPSEISVFVSAEDKVLNLTNPQSITLKIDVSSIGPNGQVVLSQNQLGLPSAVSFVRFGQDNLKITISGP